MVDQSQIRALCPYCRKGFKKLSGYAAHIRVKRECRDKHEAAGNPEPHSVAVVPNATITGADDTSAAFSDANVGSNVRSYVNKKLESIMPKLSGWQNPLDTPVNDDSHDMALNDRKTTGEEFFFAENLRPGTIGTEVNKNFKMSGLDLAMSEELIKSGFARNYNELMQKINRFQFNLLKHFGKEENKMMGSQEDDDMQKLIKQQMQTQMLESIKGSGSGGGFNMNKMMESMMMMQMVEKMFTGGKSGGDDDFKRQMIDAIGQQNMKMLEMQQRWQEQLSENKREKEMQELRGQVTQFQSTTQRSAVDEAAKLMEIQSRSNAEVEKMKMEVERERQKMMLDQWNRLRDEVTHQARDKGFDKFLTDTLYDESKKKFEEMIKKGLNNSETPQEGMGDKILGAVTEGLKAITPIVGGYMENRRESVAAQRQRDFEAQQQAEMSGQQATGGFAGQEFNPTPRDLGIVRPSVQRMNPLQSAVENVHGGDLVEVDPHIAAKSGQRYVSKSDVEIARNFFNPNI